MYNTMTLIEMYTLVQSIFIQILELSNYLMGYLSISMTKGLPYNIFIKQILKEIMERGQLNQIKKKWETNRNCAPVIRTGKPLTLAKLITLFGIVLLGVVLALIILFVEMIFNSIKPSESPPYDEMFKIRLKHNLVAMYDLIKKWDFVNNKTQDAMQKKLLNNIDRFISEIH